MKIGIYLYELTSIGGGNRHALAVAEYLSRRHQVEIITQTPLGAARTLDGFGFDLDAVRLRCEAVGDARKLAPLTAEYDLFINRFHNVYIPNRATHSALMVLFPIPIDQTAAGWLRRKVARMLRSRLIRYSLQRGVYEEEYHAGSPMRLLDQQAQIALHAAGPEYWVGFRLQNLSQEPRTVEVALDGVPVSSVQVPAYGLSPECRVTIPARRPGPPVLLTLAVPGSPPSTTLSAAAVSHREVGHIALRDFRLSHPSHRLYEWLFEHRFPEWRQRLLTAPPDDALACINGYERIWSNSQFTREWVARYWQRDSDVIYPLIALDAIVPGAKQPRILSVGRFFPSDHNKKHLTMVEAFVEMCRQGLRDWSLHLVGEVTDDPVHQDYFRQVAEAARGYPIHLHANLPLPELWQLYGHSSIYWHAAGFGEDAEGEPIKLEHFGITTVEAMAGGCVPVVIELGGQPEIVSHGQNGFLWQTVSQLQEYTLRLIQDPELRRRMSEVAVLGSRRFDRRHFGAQIDATLAQMGLG